jgi:hypothetical protein
LKVIDSAGNIGEDIIEIHFLEKEESMISFSATPTNIALDNSISVSGSLTPSNSDINVTIIYTIPQILGGEKLSRSARVNSNGGFNDTFKPFWVGSWSVKAYWEGNMTVHSSTSEEVTFTVSKTLSSISCVVSSSSLTIGNSVIVSGSLIPAISDKVVTFTYTKPGNKTVFRTSPTNLGNSSDLYTPDIVGSWSVIASWNGDETTAEATSIAVSFTVIGAFRFPSETLVSSILIVLFLLSLYFSKSINFYFSKLKKKL